MAHVHAEVLLKLQVCCWIDFSNKKYYICRRTNKVIHLAWVTALCDAETWTVQKIDQKQMECFEMWGWRRMEIIS